MSIFLFWFSFFSTAQAAGNHESVNHAPPFQIHQYDSDFEAKYGKDGANSICWPSSLAGRMLYFQKYRKPNYPKLGLASDPKANVPKFIDLCHTQMHGGTQQSQKVPCMLRFIREAGYPGDAYVVGKAAQDSSHRHIEIAEIRNLLRKDKGVILHVGWLVYDPGRRRWQEHGSHSLNAYGFDYDEVGGKEKMRLKVANPMIDYSQRSPNQMFDEIEMHRPTELPSMRTPPDAEWILTGPGFDRPDRVAVLENIYVFQVGTN